MCPVRVPAGDGKTMGSPGIWTWFWLPQKDSQVDVRTPVTTSGGSQPRPWKCVALAPGSPGHRYQEAPLLPWETSVAPGMNTALCRAQPVFEPQFILLWQGVGLGSVGRTGWAKAGHIADTWQGVEEVTSIRCLLPWSLKSTAMRQSLLPPGPREANSHRLPHERWRSAW